jgi:replicative DNA helicase
VQQQQEHLRSADRLEPFELAAASHRAVLAAIHRVHLRAPDAEIDPFAVVGDLEANGAAHVASEVSALLDHPSELGSMRALADRLRKLYGDRELSTHISAAAAALAEGRTEDAIESMRAGIDERGKAERIATESAHETAEKALRQLCERKAYDVNRSGFPLLDRAIGGFPEQTMAVLGGDTGAGKSSLLLAFAHNLTRTNRKVGIVSCEDAQAVWGPRVLAHFGDVNSERFFDAQMSAEFMHHCSDALERARGCGIEFAYALNRPLTDVLAAIRALVVDKGCRVVAVDYIQAIRLRGEDRRIATGNAAQAIKAECQALGVPLILLSQLKRRDSAQEPSAFDLKEAGELENCAEIVMLLWKTDDTDSARVLGKVAKVKWSPRRPRFEVQRSPSTGAVSGLAPYAPQPQRQPRQQWEE